MIKKDLYKLGLLRDVKLYSHRTRDNPKLKSFITRSGAIFLEKYRPQKFKGVWDYWGVKNYEESIKKTSIDDNRRVKYIAKSYLIERIFCGSILDYGCGNGGFVSALSAKMLNANIVGYDANKKLIRELQGEMLNPKNDFCNFTSDFPDYKKWDIITLWHTLEHFPNPIKELLKIKKLMRSNSVLYIEVPNTIDHLNCNSDYVKHALWSEHVIIHSLKSLTTLVEYCGFDVMRYEYIQRYSSRNAKNWIYHRCGDGDLINNRELDEFEKNQVDFGISDTILMKVRISQ
ncbi:MAG TPA: class I SAM-dependent methyltransferase [Candidatus Nitrosocosmicus sp.]|nr:class I SAM-dependent methyltransferase [Candidatus Nitrosocosmicus sp.]